MLEPAKEKDPDGPHLMLGAVTASETDANERSNNESQKEAFETASNARAERKKTIVRSDQCLQTSCCYV